MMFQTNVPTGLEIILYLKNNWFIFMKNSKSSVRVISCENGKMTFEGEHSPFVGAKHRANSQMPSPQAGPIGLIYNTT